MPNLDLTGFAPIDFPVIVIFLKNGILEMLEKKLKHMINKIVEPASHNPRKFYFLTEF